LKNSEEKMTKEEKKEFHEIFGNVSPKQVKKGVSSVFQAIDENPGFNILKGTDKDS
jgi:hypothetical protein